MPALQAEEMLLAAHVQRIATGAGATVAASSGKAARAAFDAYEGLVRQLTAQRDGIDLGAVAEAGRKVLTGADDLRAWFWNEGGVRL